MSCGLIISTILKYMYRLAFDFIIPFLEVTLNIFNTCVSVWEHLFGAVNLPLLLESFIAAQWGGIYLERY